MVSRSTGKTLEGSGFVPEPPPNLGPGVYMVVLDMIFIPLATLKAVVPKIWTVC